MQALNVRQSEEVSAGLSAATIGLGLAMFGLGLSIAATGGLAALPIGIVLGAGTLGEIGVAGAALGLAGSGGVAVGLGLQK